MKNNRTKHYCGVAIATLLLGGAGLTFANDDLLIQDFTADANGTGVEWGSSTVAWDGVEGNPAGSLLITATFGNASDSPMVDYVCIAGGNPWWQPVRINFSEYTNIQFDIKWDNTSELTIDQFNDLGTWPTDLTNSTGTNVFESWAGAGYLDGSTDGINIQLCGGPAGQRGPSIFLTNVPAAAASGWAHVEVPINPAQSQIDGANGIVFDKWIKQQWGIANPVVVRFWVDNVKLGGIAVPVPPPTMTMQPTTAGLELSAIGDGRYNIHPVSPGYSFVGSPETTYSMTIKKYPNSASYPNFQTHMFLVPAGSLPYGPGDTACDWNCTNMVYIQIANNADGSAYSKFMWKTNVGGGGWGSSPQQIFGQNQIELGSTAILGTWSLKIQNSTNVTWTAPDGSFTNFIFAPEAAAYFSDTTGLYPYFGMQANSGGNVGQSSVMAEIKITGGVDGVGIPSPDIDDTFATAPLNTTTWAKAAQDPTGIQVIAADTPYAVSWTVPDSGFSLQYNASVSAPQSEWGDPLNLMANVIQVGASKRALVPASLLSGGQQYFELVKRVATQLQVLLPGETNAPGTTTGKIGTPDPVSLGAGGLATVTVYAVDATWHIITSGSDTVSFSSTDTTALFSPANGALANGTMQTTVAFQAEGSWTITATGTTFPAATSSPVTVGP